MATDDFWSPSQRQAWQYVTSAYDQGMTQTEALRQYRQGGGAIRTQSWGELWHRYDTGSDGWGSIYQYGSTDVLPASVFTQVGIRYRERYTMQFTATVRDEMGNVVHSVYRQVSSDRLLTVGEWQRGAAESLLEDISQGVSEVIAIEDVAFFERMG